MSEARQTATTESALIVVHWIGQLYNQSFYPQTGMVTLEMLEKIAKHLPFEIRLARILPYAAKSFDQNERDQSQSRVKVSPYDFKVFQNYVMPIIRKMMEQSKEHGKVDNRGKYIIDIEADPLMRHELAKNLAKIAKVRTRLLEVAQGQREA